MDGVLPTAALARRPPDFDCRPHPKGIYGHSDCGGALSRHASVRSARRQRSWLSVGKGLEPGQSVLLRYGRSAVALSGPSGAGSLCGRRCGWGYYLPILGEKKIKQHWRYLVARWGAYPTIWCLAGEGTMPYYLSENKERDKALAKDRVDGDRALSPLHGSLRPSDHNPSSDSARNTVDDPAVLDFDMLQTGHSDRNSIPNTVRRVTESLSTVAQDASDQW